MLTPSIILLALICVFPTATFFLHIAVPFWFIRKFSDPKRREVLITTPHGAEIHVGEKYRVLMRRLFILDLIFWCLFIVISFICRNPVFAPLLILHLFSAYYDNTLMLSVSTQYLEKWEQVSWSSIFRAWRKSFMRSFFAIILLLALTYAFSLFSLLALVIYTIIEGTAIHEEKFLDKFIEAYKQPMR